MKLAGPMVIALALVALGSRARDAVAQEEPAPLRVKLGANGTQATVSFDVSGAFTEPFRKKLRNGLKSEVVIEMELFDAQNQSLEVTVRACRLRLDLWTEDLFFDVKDEKGRQAGREKLVDDALKVCGVVTDLPIADRSLLGTPSGYRLIVRVALNPISKEVLERTREFMANPRGGASGGRPRAFFGAVAKLFRSDSTAGGERFIFQSQPLSRP